MTLQEYLTAKRTLDDRAIDRGVLDRFSTGLAERAAAHPERPIELLEAGAGTGTMIARLVEWDYLPDRVDYTGIDRNPRNVRDARNHAPRWVENAGYTIEPTETGFHARKGEQRLTVQYEVDDVFSRSASVDAVIACAFCDLIELPAGLDELFDLISPSGLLYAPITYDGRTRFVPEDSFDETIESLYHTHMNVVREQPGSPDAGCRLLDAARTLDAPVLAVGGSDWISRPLNGSYPARERVVITKILETIADAVREVPDAPSRRIGEWERRRTSQLRNAELTYLAHNLDILLQRPRDRC